MVSTAAAGAGYRLEFLHVTMLWRAIVQCVTEYGAIREQPARVLRPCLPVLAAQSEGNTR